MKMIKVTKIQVDKVRPGKLGICFIKFSKLSKTSEGPDIINTFPCNKQWRIR